MRAIAILAALAATLTAAQAQTTTQRTYTLTVTGDEAGLILTELGKMPWKDVNPLMIKLIGQVNSQSQPALPAPSTTPKE